MPCNTDYMDPTPAERAQGRDQTKKIKEHLDFMVHQADLMREDILAVVEGRQKKTSINFSETDPKNHVLLEMLEAHDRMYVSHRDVEFDNLIKNVQKQYLFVVQAGKRLERDGSLSSASMTAIHTQQVLHRFGDMIRVIGQYTSKVRFTPQQVEDIRRFTTVDYTKPLIPQIGFDPDDV